MTYEVDIRLMLRALARRWKTVVASSLAVVAVTVVTSLLVPSSYRASVLLNAPVHRTLYGVQITKSNYIGLALNNELALTVYQELDGRLHTEVARPGDLLTYVRARSGQGDTFSIQATMPDPEDAVLLANTWADYLVVQAGRFYGVEEVLDHLAEVRLEALEQVEAADTALTDFRASTGIGLTDGGYGMFSDQATIMGGAERFGTLGLRWRAESALLADYQVALDHLRLVRDEAESARANPDAETVLPLELLRVPILEEDPDLAPEALAGQNLQALVGLLSEKEEMLAAATEQIRVRVEELQQQVEEQGLRFESLLRTRRDAWDIYQQVRKKEWDMKLWQVIHSHPLSIVAPAREAPEVVPVGLEARLIIAAVVGAILGALTCWWQEFGRRATGNGS